MIVRRRLALALGVLAAIAAAPARAQDAGTGVGALAASDFFIGVQHQEGSNLSDFDVARFFNKANCDCDEPVFLFFTLLPSGFAKRSSVIGMAGNVEFWVGQNCNQPLIRNAQCKNLGVMTIAAFFNLGKVTLPTNARVMSTYTTATGTVIVDDAGIITNDDAGQIINGVTTGVFTPTPDCTAPVDQFSQSAWLLVDFNADQSYEVSATRAVGINLTPPPEPTNVNVLPGNEALTVTWTAIDSLVVTDLLGYQILCKRGANLQVFSNGTFSAGFKSCPTTTTGTGPEGLDVNFACSPLLSRTTTSFRVKILQNGIPYGATVVAIDTSGNASPPDLFYTEPIKTKSFYDVYREPNPNPGAATGGYCAVGPVGARGWAALPVGGALAAVAVLARRRRRRP